MKSKVLMLLAASCLLVYSCSKNEHHSLPGSPGVKNEQPNLKEGGEDDDGPVILEITKDQNDRPVTGALVSLTNETEERHGYTDHAGHCLLQLPETGDWNLTVVYEEHTFVNTGLNILDSFYRRIDTLLIE